MARATTLPDVLRAFDRAIGLEVAPVSRRASTAVDSVISPTHRAAAAGERLVEVRPERPAARTGPVLREVDQPPQARRVAEAIEAPVQEAPAPAALLGHWNLSADWLTDPGSHDARLARLQAIRTAHDAGCPHCTTATYHRQTVFGEGNASAQIVFVGEAPGETEDELGRPFVGRAGQKLEEMIKAMGLSREEVYIANALKSRPPDNRTPLQHEVDACGPYLMAQLLAIRPQVIVTLGGPATKLVLGETQGITRLRGLWRSWTPPQGSGLAEIAVMPTYHPAYVLRNYTPKVRGEVWSDLKSVLVRLGRTAPGGSAS